MPACGSKDPGGTLMLGFSTDMEVPDDVTAVGVLIKNGDDVRLRSVTKVEKGTDGKYRVRLPATLAIRGPAGTNAAVIIKVMAFGKDGNAFVIRQAQATTPTTSRIALLKMPLLWINRGDFTGTTPSGTAAASKSGLKLAVANDASQLHQLDTTNDCGGDGSRHRVNGKCVGVPVYDGDDSASLPNYADTVFFGATTGSGGQVTCFDVANCLSKPGITVRPDANCAFDVTGNVDAINVGVEPLDGTGICAEASTGKRCIVALAKNDEGVTVTASAAGQVHVILPATVCARGFKSVVVSNACQALGPSQLVCNHSSADDTTPAALPPTDALPVAQVEDDAGDAAIMSDATMSDGSTSDGSTPNDGGPLSDSAPDSGDGGDGGDGATGDGLEAVGPRIGGMGSVAMHELFAHTKTAVYAAGLDPMGNGPVILRYERQLPAATQGVSIYADARASTLPGRPIFVAVGGGASSTHDVVSFGDPTPYPAASVPADRIRALDFDATMGTTGNISWNGDVAVGAKLFGVVAQGINGVDDGVNYIASSAGGTQVFGWGPRAGTSTPIGGLPDFSAHGQPLTVTLGPATVGATAGYPIIGTTNGSVVTFNMGALSIVANANVDDNITAMALAPDNDTVYFVAVGVVMGDDRIYRASLAAAGSTPPAPTLVKGGLSLNCGYNAGTVDTAYPCGLAVTSTKIYFGSTDGTISAMPVAGTPVTPFASVVNGKFRGMVADTFGNYLYFADYQPYSPGTSGGLFRKPLLL